jgi:5-methylcytosine-specific restriction endonuclease McrA
MADKEYNKKYHAEWYKKNRERRLVQLKNWIKNNPEKGRAAALRWRNKNLEKARANASRWYADPANNAKHHNARRARKLKTIGKHTAADIAEIAKLQKYRCAYCRKKLRKFYIDHIIPLATGGSNDRTNLQITCQSCNARKRHVDPVEFARKIGMLV